MPSLPYTRQSPGPTSRRAADLRSDVDEHHGFGLPAQGVLQQLSQLAVAEGNVSLLVGQGRHHIACGSSAKVKAHQKGPENRKHKPIWPTWRSNEV